MKIGVPREIAEGERRVALVPDIVRKLTGQGHEVVLEPGAGTQAGIPDALFEEAGASLGGGEQRCGKPARHGSLLLPAGRSGKVYRTRPIGGFRPVTARIGRVLV